MLEIVNISLPASGLCKLMSGGSQRGEGHLGNFHLFFQTYIRNDSCCLSDLLKIAPRKEHFVVCIIVYTGRFCTLMYYSSNVGSD